MKVEKLKSCTPAYPARKASKLGAIAAAAALAAGSLIGCRPQIMGDLQVDPGFDENGAVVSPAAETDPPEVMGELAVDDTEVPGEPQTTGLFYFPDPTESSPCAGTETPDDSLEPELMGDVAVFPEELP